jgi:hypothetical protein
MKRYGLLLATVASLLITGLALHSAGWFPDPVRNPAMHGAGVPSSDASAISAAWFYRQGYPRHWRNCLLQR